MKARYWFFVLTAGVLIPLLQNCGPVQFANKQNAGIKCPVNQPCIGPSGENTVEQQFSFNGSNKIDVLFIDDNSSSMRQEQENLGTRFQNFISRLAGTDWRIGVVSTDVCPDSSGFKCTPWLGGLGQFMGPLGSNPRYGGDQYIIGPQTPNPDTKFYQTIQRELEQGARDERGIKAISMAIDRRGSVSQFFRSDAQLAVVILSDEDERSLGGYERNSNGTRAQPCATPNGTTQCAPLETEDQPTHIIGKATDPGTWGSAKSFVVHSLIIRPGDNTCLNQQISQGGGAYGYIYKDVSDQTGGITGSICDYGDGVFTQTLQNIGDAVRNQPSNILTLAHVPKAAPTVRFEPAGHAVNYTWTPGSNQVVLASVPPTPTVVSVTYTY
ncbi:MAG: hypothetical protein IT289_01030 [Oligoflexia bacterium]|nr:hypothetical protein [Oligoflexia bacterium]